MEKLDKYTVHQKQNIRNAIKKMDKGGIGFVVCVAENDEVVGVISDGDFRRAILNGVSLDENVLKIINKKFRYLKKGFAREDALAFFRNKKVQHIPILENGKLIRIITEEEFFDIKHDEAESKCIDMPVVIMAGGKGTRLEPLTRILPKPLIPLGNKTMIEVIMDEYARYGINDFYISVNHKAKMIRAYFADQDVDYNIGYVSETRPLGTAGALKYLEGEIDSSFFVSNCDIIIKEDYGNIYDFHKSRKFDLTVIASMQHHTVPYGVCEINNGGELKVIREKPEYDFLVNAGMYLLEPTVFELIPKDEYCDMTDLIERVQDAGMTVGVYPVSESSYVDVGQLAEYKKTVGMLLDY